MVVTVVQCDNAKTYLTCPFCRNQVETYDSVTGCEKCRPLSRMARKAVNDHENGLTEPWPAGQSIEVKQ